MHRQCTGDAEAMQRRCRGGRFVACRGGAPAETSASGIVAADAAGGVAGVGWCVLLRLALASSGVAGGSAGGTPVASSGWPPSFGSGILSSSWPPEVRTAGASPPRYSLTLDLKTSRRLIGVGRPGPSARRGRRREVPHAARSGRRPIVVTRPAVSSNRDRNYAPLLIRV